ncbi:MAG: Ppx/GppA phosphatase family protein [Bacteroidota bacterium]
MRVSAIDIGTNTILLLIADVSADGSVRVIRDEQVIARLGKGVDASRRILPETFGRAEHYLREYKAFSDEAHVDKFFVCGTSFLRDARNRQEFVDVVRDRLGLEVSVLSGDDEAALTYVGAVSEFQTAGRQQDFVVLDIGGGSTEITVGTESEVAGRTSLDMGSVRITERFLTTSPPLAASLDESSQFIRRLLQQLPPIPEAARFVGVAGTLTTLAALALKLPQYDRSKVSGYILRLTTIQSIFDELKTKDPDGLRSFPQILPGRADIILAGVMILLETLRHFQRNDITVSDRGLRYGMALRAARGTGS